MFRGYVDAQLSELFARLKHALGHIRGLRRFIAHEPVQAITGAARYVQYLGQRFAGRVETGAEGWTDPQIGQE